MNYIDGKAIGSHEVYLNKLGSATLNATYRVTYVSQSSNSAIVMVNGELLDLKVGTIIYEGQLISTNSSHVEIISSMNQLYRLGTESEFCIENTAEGVLPVVFGKVYRKFLRGIPEFISGGKYRTSCWNGMEETAILNLDGTKDEYYSFENAVNIYEYDEAGRQFQIAHMEPFTKIILSFDESSKMRQRYKVSSVLEMTNREIDWIYNVFVKPINWR